MGAGSVGKAELGYPSPAFLARGQLPKTSPMPTLNRRDFLGAGLGLALSSPLLPAVASTAPRLRRNGKKMLVLGGTRFLGPAVVHAAQAAGYEVTLFNRGKSNPESFPELEKRRGDRDTGDLDALAEGEWDLVVDTSGYVPEHVRATARLLADRVQHYVFISTCSVYAPSPGGGDLGEDGAIQTLPEGEVMKIRTIGEVFRQMQFYGPLKALCEQAAEAAMPGRVTSFRPGVIVGRDDPTDRFSYWAIRVEQGGEVLCPGDPDARVQFTDVRDLGEFCVDFGAARKAGVYNAAGFAMPVTMQELLHGCKIVLGADARFTWVGADFLMQNQVRPFVELPLWLPEPYAVYFGNDKGVAAGMEFRPVGDTIREMVEWFHEVRDGSYRWGTYGMQPEREAELLAAWRARPAETELAPGQG